MSGWPIEMGILTYLTLRNRHSPAIIGICYSASNLSVRRYSATRLVVCECDQTFYTVRIVVLPT